MLLALQLAVWLIILFGERSLAEDLLTQASSQGDSHYYQAM